MTRGAWMCSRQYDDGLKICFAPRENEKPFTDSERAQKWRLSLASLLFFTVLLSDHLWFCAEAKLTRTRDKEQQQQQQPEYPERQLLSSMGEPSPAAQAAHRLLSSPLPPLPPSPSSSCSSGGSSNNNNSNNNNNKAIFLGNSTKPFWRLETCYPQSSASGQCFSVEDADSVCRRRWSREQQVTGNHPTPSWNLTDFYLSFCNSYTLWELFTGLSNPDTLNCSLDVVLEGEGSCSQCVQAYQRYDQHAQEKYEEFEVMLQKYLQSDEYSVNSCPEDCKIVYKAWLCSQYFEVTQFHCSNRIPCKQYCLEVQTRCPFILPDNDDVIYGGLSSFICTGLYENYPTNAEPECCDVRWGLLPDNQSKGTIKTSDSSMCHRTSLTVSSASRLCNSRLKLCVLVLILLHTVLTVSAAQNSTGLGFGGITTLEDNSTNDE
ncbi:NALCN channel auxiliary factor 1 [Gopherus flavomarginatus]|uniref:NALCN channel auxiliary factor 1 n=1 Tax=Gopherus flavomarginatus TaxID=286002 RepID=UPI0021CC232B|nr:NALCN channel auxiliary factor 1 [Gopherus flavomarginatus]